MLSEKTIELCQKIGISAKDLEMKVHDTINLIKKKNIDSKAPILVNFDMNGPLMAVDDASLTPYPHVKDCLGILLNSEGVLPIITTGWDAITVKTIFDKLGVPIGIVAEKGMLFYKNGKVTHFYSHSEKENEEFMDAVVDIAAPGNLKIAIQPNLSSGFQCIYIEGDVNGNLINHPLVKGRKVSIKDFYDLLKNCRGVSLEGARIVASNTGEFRSNLYKVMTVDFPLISLRFSFDKKGNLVLERDERDKMGFDLKKLEHFATLIGTKLGRIPRHKYDFCIDFWTREAKSKATKEEASKSVAKQFFDGGYWQTIVGDEPYDLFTGSNSINFVMPGSDLEKFAKEKAADFITVKDGREYALIIYELRRLLK